jgi:hypothetical protein
MYQGGREKASYTDVCKLRWRMKWIEITIGASKQHGCHSARSNLAI